MTPNNISRHRDWHVGDPRWLQTYPILAVGDSIDIPANTIRLIGSNSRMDQRGRFTGIVIDVLWVGCNQKGIEKYFEHGFCMLARQYLDWRYPADGVLDDSGCPVYVFQGQMGKRNFKAAIDHIQIFDWEQIKVFRRKDSVMKDFDS